LRALVLLAALGACSIPDKHFTGDGGRNIDALASGDGDPAFDCIGHEVSTNVPASVQLTGRTQVLLGTQLVGGLPIDAIRADTGGQIFTGTGDMQGAFGGTVATSGSPIPAQIRATSAMGQYIETVFVPSHAIDSNLDATINVATPNEMTQLYTMFGANWTVTSSASMFATIVDCMGVPLAGAKLTISGFNGELFYVRNQALDQTATETDGSGHVFFFTSPGSGGFSATKDVASFLNYSVSLQGGTLTQLTIQP
jgi:hypothetical protein